MIELESESGEEIDIIGDTNKPSGLTARIEVDEEITTSPAQFMHNPLATKSNVNLKVSRGSGVLMLTTSNKSTGKISMRSQNQEEIDEGELEEEIGSIKERMLMNQMPAVGDLKSVNKKDVKQRVRAIQSLLEWKETKSVEIRQSYNEKIRKITAERDTYEKRCQQMNQRMIELDKQKAALEYKVRAAELSKPRTLGRSSITESRTASVGKSGVDLQLKKTQVDLRKAQMEVENLNTQLDKAHRNMNSGGLNIVDRSTGKNNKGPGAFLGASKNTSKSPTTSRKSELLKPSSLMNSENYPVEGIHNHNFSFGNYGKEEGAVPSNLSMELQSQNARLKTMIAQLTSSINSQINKKASSSVLQDALPADLLNEIESESSAIDPTEDVEQLQSRMTTAISLMERILGEAVN